MDTSTGGIVTMSTRFPAPIKYHGSLFESLQNDVFQCAANLFFFSSATRSPVRLNQYGGTFGGPIRKGQKRISLLPWEENPAIDSLRYNFHGFPTVLKPARRFFQICRSYRGEI